MDAIQVWLQERLVMLAIMAAFALIDMIGGALIAIKKGEFKLEKLPEFVKTFAVNAWAWASVELIAYLPVYFNVEIKGLTELLVMYSGSAVYAFIMLKYAASVLGHVQNSDVMPLKAERALSKIGVPPDVGG